MSSDNTSTALVNVKILFFAKARELAGVNKVENFELPIIIRLDELLDRLTTKFNLLAIKHNLIVALNEAYCDNPSQELQLKEGDEVAIIPPISGDVTAVTDLVRDGTCGAISIFIGTTRDNFEGQKVVSLEYEAYEPMALKEMTSICEDIRTKWSEIAHIAVHHRLGVVPEKEASVMIALSSPHRKAALVALEFAIDELKRRVPIWKKELYDSSDYQWKENKECLWRRNDFKCTEHPYSTTIKHNKLSFSSCKVENESDDVQPNLIQITASEMEIERRIKCFVKKKREEININNILDFTMAKSRPLKCSDEDVDMTCARTNASLVKQQHSTGHLKVRRVANRTGPQVKFNYLHTLDKLKYETKHKSDGVKRDVLGLKSSDEILNERLLNLEDHLGIVTSKPINIAQRSEYHRRIKVLENRILYLESVSPEYSQLITIGRPTAEAKSTRKVEEATADGKQVIGTTYTLDDLDSIIANLTNDADQTVK